ncbi:kinase-like domain-containing protein [Aspergillus crustosus]
MSTTSTQSGPFSLPNLQPGHKYIKDNSNHTLIPCAASAVMSDFIDLPTHQEFISVHAKRANRIVVEYNSSYIIKRGADVRRTEADAMCLVGKHTSIPAPRVWQSRFTPDVGAIKMSLIPGTRLEEKWDTLEATDKERICREVWYLTFQFHFVPQPEELSHLFVCSADGSPLQHPMFKDWEEQPRHLMSDAMVRARIYDLYLRAEGRLYEDILSDMLPRAQASIFTHGDIKPHNILIDEQNKVTGILGWEHAGWYPDYWEYAQAIRYDLQGDWPDWMEKTAPRKWDLTGLNAARNVLCPVGLLSSSDSDASSSPKDSLASLGDL